MTEMSPLGSVNTPLAKHAEEIVRADDIPAAIGRAFEIALGDRPGPVVLALPEDVQREETGVADAPYVESASREPKAKDIERLRGWIVEARRPLFIVGGPRWNQESAEVLAAWAGASAIPVAAQYRRQDRIDNAADAYVGDLGLGVNPGLADRIRESDCVVLLGGRFGDVPSGGYTRLGIPRHEGGRLVHIHADPAELGHVYEPDLAIAATAPAVLEALVERGPIAGDPSWAAALRADYVAWSTPHRRELQGVDMAAVMEAVEEVVPDDAIVANGAGNYTVWIHRYHRYHRFGTQLAPTSGAMGYGIPAAIAAALHEPTRSIIAFAGDGCFQMSGHELATAVQLGLRFVIVVVDNRMLGTIRMHQERSFPGRVEATTLINPDFVALAQAYGCHAERVERDEQIAGALERALAADRPALLHLVCDPRAISPTAFLADE
jgi:acetolactate synthase-1/2/3 large subunit